MAVDFLTVVQNLQDHVEAGGPLWTLVNGIAYISAMVFGYIALLQLKQVGDNQRQSLQAPILSFVAAAVMMSAPEALSSVLTTAYGKTNDNPLSYVKDSAGSNKSLYAVLQLVSFMGYVFFIRGIWTLKEAGEPQRYPQSTVIKAFTILFAGMASIYIDFTLKILSNTFGFNISAYIS